MDKREQRQIVWINAANCVCGTSCDGAISGSLYLPSTTTTIAMIGFNAKPTKITTIYLILIFVGYCKRKASRSFIVSTAQSISFLPPIISNCMYCIAIAFSNQQMNPIRIALSPIGEDRGKRRNALQHVLEMWANFPTRGLAIRLDLPIHQ